MEMIVMNRQTNAKEFGAVHALPNIIEGPIVFLRLDSPRWDPKDIILVNPEDGTSETFISPREQS